ncbi:hypothetical protein GSI_04647 [Ganoderma sinense ZZ0214-1]|uniref:Uncharacterized protein n=1 Tax=Ganoderma sinense ZZ0214-1 TaxID=1077348 RepID=A0A2G8SHK4_9APHY|nr:hypothetical protein GSI_04647 [Ganoderma sinense ZZ0214-1]
MEARSSSYSTVSAPEISLNELVSRRHANFITLPEELCPTSRPSSPTSSGRILATRNYISGLVNLAGGDPANPKWGNVSRFAHLACTSRGYVPMETGVRIGDGRQVSVGKGFKWELPETEQEWAAYERRWEEAVAEETRKRAKEAAKANDGAKASKTSKYFKPSAEPDPPPRPSSKAEVIREKVERWQAQVVSVVAVQDVPTSQEMTESPLKVIAEKVQVKAKGGKVQASLGFPVVKRASTSSGKGGSSASSKPKLSPTTRVSTPPSDEPMPSAPKEVPEPMARDIPAPPQETSEQAVVAQITEVPELSFLPPSFPSQLQTSTPPLNDKRRKPQPIAPCSPPPTSPLSATSFDAAKPKPQDAQQASSSQSLVSPIRKPQKRGRNGSESTDDDRMDISQSPAATRSPLAKKARTDKLAQAAVREPASSGSAPAPPSTLPLVSSLPTAPVTPVSRHKGLGNAKGIPVPSTPNSNPLPNLTDLLATSRRSKPRPRPPSRKSTPHSRARSRESDEAIDRDTDLPAVDEDDEDRGREPSPTKTYFSSPASGSSGSPGSVAQRPASPVSPLGFTQHPSAFAPRFVSSQRLPPLPLDGEDPFLVPPHAPARGKTSTPQLQAQGQNDGGLMRGSSGFFGMGYSSQFDVEGHVEQVSEILGHDVDFDGWLRDPDEDEPGHDQDQDQDMSVAAQGASQDACTVGADR